MSVDVCNPESCAHMMKFASNISWRQPL